MTGNTQGNDDTHLESPRESLCSSHRTGGSAEPATAGPSEEMIRMKAYELWEQGGRMNGSDRDD